MGCPWAAFSKPRGSYYVVSAFIQRSRLGHRVLTIVKCCVNAVLEGCSGRSSLVDVDFEGGAFAEEPGSCIAPLNAWGGTVSVEPARARNLEPTSNSYP